MRPNLLAAILCGALLAPASAPANRDDPSTARSLWVWGTPDLELVPFARRHDMAALYMHAPPGHASDRDFRQLGQAARRRGVELWAMSGAPSWATEPRTVVRWVREVTRAGFYDGIVVDIEPYVLDAWSAGDRTELISSYLRGLRQAHARAGDLPFLAAVPFWFDHDGYRHHDRSLLDLVLESTDGVVVLAYRDQAQGRDGILRLAGGEVERAAALGKTAVLGVQTAADELDKLTFFEEGSRVLEREIRSVENSLRGAPGFGGVAIHYYDSLRRLRQ